MGITETKQAVTLEDVNKTFVQILKELTWLKGEVLKIKDVKPPKYYDKAEAADYLKCSTQTVEIMAEDKRLQPYVRKGTTRGELFRVEEVHKLIVKKTRRTTGI